MSLSNQKVDAIDINPVITRTLYDTFYHDLLMPCCNKPIKYFKGPQGGFSFNIKCFHCGSKFNICPELRFIEKI